MNKKFLTGFHLKNYTNNTEKFAKQKLAFFFNFFLKSKNIICFDAQIFMYFFVIKVIQIHTYDEFYKSICIYKHRKYCQNMQLHMHVYNPESSDCFRDNYFLKSLLRKIQRFSLKE